MKTRWHIIADLCIMFDKLEITVNIWRGHNLKHYTQRRGYNE